MEADFKVDTTEEDFIPNLSGSVVTISRQIILAEQCAGRACGRYVVDTERTSDVQITLQVIFPISLVRKAPIVRIRCVPEVAADRVSSAAV